MSLVECVPNFSEGRRTEVIASIRAAAEALKREIGQLPERAPDFGPARLGRAGATAVGARPLLIAFNVDLASADLALARSIARAVRQSSGGLPAVQARGMATDDPAVVQV